jgi:hypothetical protein
MVDTKQLANEVLRLRAELAYSKTMIAVRDETIANLQREKSTLNKVIATFIAEGGEGVES